MSILKIAKLGHPLLFKKTTNVENIPNNDINKLIKDMTETMLDADGIGLAAPQVHVDKKVLIFRVPEEDSNVKKDQIEITALINPKIQKITEETNDQWEGCLSIPGMTGLVRRFNKIRYEGFDIKGNMITKEAEGLHARIVQHEYDHLEGILYISKLVDKRAFGFVNEIEKYWKDKNEKN